MPEILWADYAYPGGDLTGYAGVVRYLQTGNGSSRSKYDLTRQEVDAHHAAGRAVAAFWQDGGSSAGLGYDRGVRDAQRANDEADMLDAPPWWAIHYAVDDPTLDGPKVRPYFDGVLATSRRSVGAYGSYAVVEYLWKEVSIGFLIQTSSWSGGQVSPNAWLLQRDHRVPSGTGEIDVDPLLVPYAPNVWRPPVAVMTPDQRLAAFRAEGLPIVEVRNWRTNDRAPVTGLAAGPKHGTLNHHTGGETSNPLAYASGLLYDGRSDLPGPLCHEGLDVDRGVIYMIGSGRTNHAGSGDPDTLNLILADAMPLDREVRPDQSSGVDGNSNLYGLEMMYSGSRALPRVGWVAMVKWNAAYLRFHGWTAGSAAGHREWTNQKPDPGMVDLAALRRDIRDCLALPPGVWGSTTTEVPDMDATQDARLRAVEATVNDLATFLHWGLDPSPDFKGPAFQYAGELTQRLRRLGSADELKAFITQALIDDVDVAGDPAALAAAVNKAVDAKWAEGFDAHISIDPEVAARQLAGLTPDAPVEPDCADTDDPNNA